jgi:choline kinase
MRAIMLAAGLGRRLDGRHPPKPLLRIGGKSLLERHLEVLRACGVDDLVLVVGHREGELRAEVERLDAGGFVRLQPNPDYARGSILSLWCARASLGSHGSDALVMDADVLYHPGLIDRLLASPHRDCLLLDQDFEPGDEPVKVGVRGGRVVEFGKRIAGAELDLLGEWPGFIKLSAAAGSALAGVMADLIAAGGSDAPMEDAIRELIVRRPGLLQWEDITGLPWIEIDFVHDLERARREILPRIEPAGRPLALAGA